MGSDNTTKIAIMAAVLAVLIVGFVLFFLRGSGNTGTASNPGGPTTGTASRIPGQPGAPAMAGITPSAPALQPPPPPKILQAPTLAMTGILDPFKGGPYTPPPLPPKWPYVVPVSTVPSVLPYKTRPPMPPADYYGDAPIEMPAGRLAGWIFNNNGQIVAIFEDTDGVAHTVHVGDDVAGYHVKAIMPDIITLVDKDGVEHQLKLQGLDTYPGKSRTVNVNSVPTTAAPAWGAQ